MGPPPLESRLSVHQSQYKICPKQSSDDKLMLVQSYTCLSGTDIEKKVVPIPKTQNQIPKIWVRVPRKRWYRYHLGFLARDF